MTAAKRCHCDGRYEGCEHKGLGSCDVPGGGRWSTYFCPDCDVRRVDHISTRLEAITADASRRPRGANDEETTP